MPYILKSGQETFEVVDGEFVGRRYAKETVYETIPAMEADRFDKIDMSTGTVTDIPIGVQVDIPEPNEYQYKEEN
jgi:hypothetical protein